MEAGGQDNPVTTDKKTNRKVSWVWKYFTKDELSGINTCKLCGYGFSLKVQSYIKVTILQFNTVKRIVHLKVKAVRLAWRNI